MAHLPGTPYLNSIFMAREPLTICLYFYIEEQSQCIENEVVNAEMKASHVDERQAGADKKKGAVIRACEMRLCNGEIFWIESVSCRVLVYPKETLYIQ